MGSEVTEVYAKGAALVNPSFAELGDIDTAVITLTFANGAMGVIDNSRQAVYGYDQRVEVFGTKGSAAADNSRPTTVEVSTADFVMKDKPHFFFLNAIRKPTQKRFFSLQMRSKPIGRLPAPVMTAFRRNE